VGRRSARQFLPAMAARFVTLSLSLSLLESRHRSSLRSRASPSFYDLLRSSIMMREGDPSRFGSATAIDRSYARRLFPDCFGVGTAKPNRSRPLVIARHRSSSLVIARATTFPATALFSLIFRRCPALPGIGSSSVRRTIEGWGEGSGECMRLALS